jgi:hypothetical protein
MKSALFLLCAILLAPLALVDIPPLLDYPNHLARATVLAFGAADPFLSRMYAAHWSIIPNLGTDLVLPPLLRVLPIHLAGRLVVGCALLLPVIGTIAYSRATFGTHSAWPLASVLVAYNATLLLGFLNFVASLGIALLLAAAWIAWRNRAPRRLAALAVIGTIALFFCHLMGLVFCCALIAGYELEWIAAHRTDRVAIVTRIAVLVPLAAAPLTLYAMSPLAPLAAETEFPSLADRARHLLFPFLNYVLPLDIATACAVGAFLLACIAKGRCRITWGSGLALLMVAGFYLLAPWAFKGTFYVDTRFAIMLGFLLFGAVLPAGLSRGAAMAAVAVFTVLFAARMAVVTVAWHDHRHDVADMRAATAGVAPGARVFVAAVSQDADPAYRQGSPLSRKLSNGIRLDDHLAALLLIERRAYWPFLFDNPSQQPVATLQPYRALAERAGSIADHRAIAVPGKVDLCGYDYLLLIDADGEPDLTHFAADRLLLSAQSDFAALFRVRPASCPSSTPAVGAPGCG